MDITKKYNINIDDLEAPLEKASEDKKIIQDDKDHDDFLRTLDINAYDAYYKFLKNSNRLCFLIRDDKIEYANDAAIMTCKLSSLSEIKGKTFLSFVDNKYWDDLAVNIGDMITKDIVTKIKIANTEHELDFKALYLSDKDCFSFILMSEPLKNETIVESSKNNEKVCVSSIQNFMYDELTGLPTFPLFEDRLRTIINHEIYKNEHIKKHYISVVVIDIKNISDFSNTDMWGNVTQKVAHNLVQGLKKSYTIARGIKHSFWILLDDILTPQDLALEVQKIEAILSAPIKSESSAHELIYKIARVTFPEEAKSAKRMLEQAVYNLKQA